MLTIQKKKQFNLTYHDNHWLNKHVITVGLRKKTPIKNCALIKHLTFNQTVKIK